MRIMTSQDAVEWQPGNVAGLKGLDFIQGDDVSCGVRTVAPRTVVPRRQNIPASTRFLVYAVKGAATVSNGEYYEKIGPGAFVLFEEGEVPQYQTAEQELQVLEISWNPAANPAARVTQVPASVAPTTEPTVVPKKTAGGVYMEI